MRDEEVGGMRRVRADAARQSLSGTHPDELSSEVRAQPVLRSLSSETLTVERGTELRRFRVDDCGCAIAIMIVSSLPPPLPSTSICPFSSQHFIRLFVCNSLLISFVLQLLSLAFSSLLFHLSSLPSVMAKKKSTDSSQSPPSYDASTTAQAGQELEQNAAPPSTGMKGIDLSRYRQPALVEALDRLTSFTYAGSLLLKPAFKIMWRSALYQDGEVRMQELLSQLTGTSPVTEPPSANAEGQPQPKKKATAPSRSIVVRLLHFFFVGLPMAVIVGLAYGLVNFVTCIWKDVMTVASTSQNLVSTAKTDLSYYMQHPEKRPTKDEAVNAWSGQIIQPYTQAIVKRKLGPFGMGWVSGPISNAVQLLIKRAAGISATEVQRYAKQSTTQRTLTTHSSLLCTAS
jgi:hypothetical protein